MKKSGYILCAFLIVILLSGCSKADESSKITKTLGINASKGTVVAKADTHGAMGDGYTFAQISFEDNEGAAVARELAGDGWKPLPLSVNLQTIVYGRTVGNARLGPYIMFEDDDNVIPAIDHGYYFFYDRQNKGNPQDDTGVLSRASFNFTIALYDTDSNMLYYYKLDT